MEAHEGYKFLGPVYFVIIWVAMLFVLHKWPRDASMTISRHVAAQRESFLLFAWVRTLALPLWALFAFGWLVPVLELPTIASVLFALTIIGDIVSAWVPAIEGRRGRVHKWSALGIGVLYIPLAVLFALSPHVNGVMSGVMWTMVALMFGWTIIFVLHKRSKEYTLYLQLSYFILYDTAFFGRSFFVRMV